VNRLAKISTRGPQPCSSHFWRAASDNTGNDSALYNLRPMANSPLSIIGFGRRPKNDDDFEGDGEAVRNFTKLRTKFEERFRNRFLSSERVRDEAGYKFSRTTEKTRKRTRDNPFYFAAGQTFETIVKISSAD